MSILSKVIDRIKKGLIKQKRDHGQIIDNLLDRVKDSLLDKIDSKIEKSKNIYDVGSDLPSDVLYFIKGLELSKRVIVEVIEDIKELNYMGVYDPKYDR